MEMYLLFNSVFGYDNTFSLCIADGPLAMQCIQVTLYNHFDSLTL